MVPLWSVGFLSLAWVVVAKWVPDLIGTTGDECGTIGMTLLQLGHNLKSENNVLWGSDSNSLVIIIVGDAGTGLIKIDLGARTYIHTCILWCIVLASLILCKPACNVAVSRIMSWWGVVAGTGSAAGASSLTALQPGLTQTASEQESGDQPVAEAYYPPPAMPTEASLLNMLPCKGTACDRPAVAGSASGSESPWTYAQLRQIMTAPVWDVLLGCDIVALALPLGPDLAIALTCLLNKATCAPLDPSLSMEESAFALRQFSAKALISAASAAPGAAEAAATLGLPSFALFIGQPMPDSFPVLQLSALRPVPSRPVQQTRASWNTSDDCALLLRTSGTTGKSKVVPLQLRQLVHGAKAIAASMDLNSDDVCLNAMPLFHIGGISCNLLGSFISGGLMICCEKRFDPDTFAALMREGKLAKQPTWYYAAPSMHLALAEAGVVKGHSLRLVRSGAAALPPTLQQRLEDMFGLGCQVLATYSMTECMPIASPVPRDFSPKHSFRCQPLGSVGRPIGPSVEVRNGEIMIRGPLVTTGYLGVDSGWTEQGLFPTGDLGRLDENGFLWLQGRKKEVINQGGETLSPQELEEQVVGHQDVQEVAAYAVPHHRLGEAVALAVVLQRCQSTASSELTNIAKGIAACLAPGRRPAAITFVGSLARTSTGKVQRLANPRVELREDDRRMVVLDARAKDLHGAPVVIRISHEPDTVAAMYAEESPGSLGSSKGEGEELYDSMGLLRHVSHCQVFETRLILNMYVVGFLGLTFVHLFSFTDALTHLDSDLRFFLRTWSANSWHLNIFFICAGYLDSKYNRDFGWREVVMYSLIPGIPIICQLLPHCVLTSTIWLNTDHPARWFFCCMLVCRSYVVGCSRVRVPKLVQAVLVVCFATWWQKARLAAAVFCEHCSIDYAFKVLVSTYGSYTDNNMVKVAHCTIVYVWAYLFLPAMVKNAVAMGPHSVRRERIIGLLCWVLFALAAVFSFQHSSLHIALLSTINVTSAGCSRQLPGSRPDDQTQLICIIPVAIPHDLILICLLGVANAYLPLNLPDLAVHYLLAALLLMPITMSQYATELVVYLTHRSSFAVVQLCGLLVACGIYLMLLAPLFQVLAMKLAGWICSALHVCAYKFSSLVK